MADMIMVLVLHTLVIMGLSFLDHAQVFVRLQDIGNLAIQPAI